MVTGILLCVFHLSQSFIPIVVSYIITTKISFVDSHVSKHKVVALEIIDIKNCQAFFVIMSLLALFFSLIIFIFDESGDAELRLSGLKTTHNDYQAIDDDDDDSIDDDDDIHADEGAVTSSDNHASHSSALSTRLVHKARTAGSARPRSKSLSDTAPLTSCMRTYYAKQRLQGRPPRPPASSVLAQDTTFMMERDDDERADNEERISNHSNSPKMNDHDDDTSPHSSHSHSNANTHSFRRRAVSFAGDCDFTPQRRAGQGQHPPIVPLSIKMPQPPLQSNSVSPSGSHRKMFFAHF